MPSVFLSHSWKDKAFARKLAAVLQKAGVRVWLDEAELKVGDSLLRKISDAISDMDYVAAILSKNSIDSPWVQKELDMAMNLEIYHNKIRVLPILIEDCKLPTYLTGKIYLDFRNQDDFDAPCTKLLASLGVSAADSLSPSFTNIRFCTESEYSDEDECCASSTTMFYTPVETIYVSWNYLNVYRGMKFSRKWYKDGVAIKKLERHDVWDELWDTDSKTVATFITNKKGHPEGKYTMRLYIEGNYICSGSFLVKRKVS
ncbi:toll/interleukin-1 receptor domain-containing protein [Candidatus Bipolaricaulota bacterium]|nr:toll/interleukin-1 receptor domain-containing protein [Candidatus Bipolaricaulota bacterium]